tara:strand:+ start:1066 stop:1251 length:186 start_codon:yes stop_codon:yes gene_type:complete
MEIADQINALLAAVSDERDTILADDRGSYSPGQALSLAVDTVAADKHLPADALWVWAQSRL